MKGLYLTMTNYFKNCSTLDDIHDVCKNILNNYYRNIYGSNGNKILSDMWKQFEIAIINYAKNQI